ncbi:hypothetical protein [Deinococcus sp. NW-56]|uniref:hypothetical protein n=1 Tax=Deinococcus sp. NW-56 TaxID=2080419 RepID=UPI00131A3069|nr:hypothetical protein [Deinococcus sp. NW-56]
MSSLSRPTTSSALPVAGEVSLSTRSAAGQTIVPTHLESLTPGLEAQSARETAARLLAWADQRDGKRSRVTFLPEVGGLCGFCEDYFLGDACPNCRGRA